LKLSVASRDPSQRARREPELLDPAAPARDRVLVVDAEGEERTRANPAPGPLDDDDGIAAEGALVSGDVGREVELRAAASAAHDGDLLALALALGALEPLVEVELRDAFIALLDVHAVAAIRADEAALRGIERQARAALRARKL